MKNTHARVEVIEDKNITEVIYPESLVYDEYCTVGNNILNRVVFFLLFLNLASLTGDCGELMNIFINVSVVCLRFNEAIFKDRN